MLRTTTMERSVSGVALDGLAPLEVGELLERKAKGNSLFRHTLGRAVLLSMIYLVAKELFPGPMEPGGSLWSLLLVWVCAYHVGHAFDAVGAPKSLGFLVSGLVLQSLPHAPNLLHALQGLVPWWSKDIRAAAMALVLLRAGLGLDIKVVRSYGWALPALATLPSLVESVVGAAFASYLFDMPYLLAWVMSFMVSAVGPAIVASGCTAVKEKGFNPKAPNLLMTASVFDDTTCIIGFNCLLHAWITGPGNVGWQYAIGPMNLVLGLFGGLCAALVMSFTSLYPGVGPRTWTLFWMGMMLIFVAEEHSLLGAGAIANLVFGLGVRHCWRKGWPRRLLMREHAESAAYGTAVADEYLKTSLAGLHQVWNIAFYPLLFGLIGAALNPRSVKPAVGKLSLAYAAFTVAVRFVATAAVTTVVPALRDNFTRGERMFIACAWVSKATTQAAFATVPLITIQAWIAAHPTGTMWKGYTAAQLLLFGQEIQWCCVLSIFMGTPLGTIFMNNGARFLLDKADSLPVTGTDGGLQQSTTFVKAEDMQAGAPLAVDGVGTASGSSEKHLNGSKS